MISRLRAITPTEFINPFVPVGFDFRARGDQRLDDREMVFNRRPGTGARANNTANSNLCSRRVLW
jgi:hypothetical protein